MPFGLKNAGSIYQWMMTKMFEPQLGRSIEVYIDDMVVKIRIVFEHVGDLTNIFEILRKHKLHLNASKCSFGVGLGKCLATWWPTGELRWTLIRSRPLTACSHFKIPRRSRNWPGWLLLWIDLYLGRQIGADLFSFCYINGKDLNGPRSVPWHFNSLKTTYLDHPSCLVLTWMSFYLPT